MNGERDNVRRPGRGERAFVATKSPDHPRASPTRVRGGGSFRDNKRDRQLPSVAYTYQGINGDLSSAPYLAVRAERGQALGFGVGERPQ